ncbi:MAG: hypothetical protein HOH95_10125 [Dehalococcoidia bacterium]|jgi:hypothetical protein|nr:hypothetical protein [Dehalococcoidia bacterium]
MESLNSLVRQAGPDDPLGRAMEAIIDSGLILFTRDRAGHFVQLSEVLGALLGMGDVRGSLQPGDTRILNSEGRLLAGIEYPATIARMTGRAQRNVLRRIERGNSHAWALMSSMPLERTVDGYTTLTIGTDVTEIVDARDSARREAAVGGALAEVGIALAGHRMREAELVALLREPMAALLPTGNVVLALRDHDELELLPVHHGFGAAIHSGRRHLAAELRERWTGSTAHVNLDVRPTDIYCGTVVAELDDPFRSMAIAPCGVVDERAALIASSAEAGAFDGWQIERLELAARLVGAALSSDERWAERRSA